MSVGEMFTMTITRLSINTHPVAFLQCVSVSCLREREAVYGFGDSEPSGFTKGKTVYEVTFRRAAQFTPEIGDQLNLQSLENFEVAIRNRGYKTTFTGCNWKRITEGGTPEAPVFEEMVLVASGRSRTEL